MGNLGACAQARAVHESTVRKKELEKIKHIEILWKNAVQIEKQIHSYTEIVKALRNSKEPIKAVLSKIKSDTLKLTYQYIGGAVSKLPNSKNETFIGVLETHESITRIDRLDQSEIKFVDNLSNSDSAKIDVLMECKI